VKNTYGKIKNLLLDTRYARFVDVMNLVIVCILPKFLLFVLRRCNVNFRSFFNKRSHRARVFTWATLRPRVTFKCNRFSWNDKSDLFIQKNCLIENNYQNYVTKELMTITDVIWSENESGFCYAYGCQSINSIDKWHAINECHEFKLYLAPIYYW